MNPEIEKVSPPWTWTFIPVREPAEFPGRQGVQEAADTVWGEFWEQLSPAEKNYYLEFWKAPEDWKEQLEFLDKMREEGEM